MTPEGLLDCFVDVAAAEACEAQLWRLAESNKTLAANYNADHVRDLCTGEQ